MSTNFMTGRLLQNMIINLDMDEEYRQGLMELGCHLENIAENDLETGCCGRCRQAACIMDALASADIPAVGYGLRFDFAANQQEINLSGETSHTQCDQVQYSINKSLWSQNG